MLSAQTHPQFASIFSNFKAHGSNRLSIEDIVYLSDTKQYRLEQLTDPKRSCLRNTNAYVILVRCLHNLGHLVNHFMASSIV